MADSEEMRRLILHAADMLDAATVNHDAETAAIAGREGATNDGAVYLMKGRQVAAAITLAETTLRFVAACMGVEEEPAKPVPTVARPLRCKCAVIDAGTNTDPYRKVLGRPDGCPVHDPKTGTLAVARDEHGRFKGGAA